MTVAFLTFYDSKFRQNTRLTRNTSYIHKQTEWVEMGIIKSFREYIKSDSFNLTAFFFTICGLFSFVIVSLYALWFGEMDMLIPLKIFLLLFIFALVVKTILDLLKSIKSGNLLDMILSLVIFFIPPLFIGTLFPFLTEFVNENSAFITLIHISIENKMFLTICLLLNVTFLIQNIVHFNSLIKRMHYLTEAKIDLTLYWDDIKTFLKKLKKRMTK